MGESFVIAGFDGCSEFGTLVRPDDRPGRLVGGVIEGFDDTADEAACPEGVTRLPGPMDGDRLVVTPDGARLDVLRQGDVVLQFVREA